MTLQNLLAIKRLLAYTPDAAALRKLQEAARRTHSPDLTTALMHAIMDALEAHSSMSTQALGSERVRDGLKDILLGPAQLYEALRAKSGVMPIAR